MTCPSIQNHLIRRQPQLLQRANRDPCHIKLPPLVAVVGGALVGAMVVVPAFAIGPEADKSVVAAVVVGFVVTGSL